MGSWSQRPTRTARRLAVRSALKEAGSEPASRRTGTGYEALFAQGERANDRALHRY